MALLKTVKVDCVEVLHLCSYSEKMLFCSIFVILCKNYALLLQFFEMLRCENALRFEFFDQ